MSAALEYHRKTVVRAPRGWEEEDGLRYDGPRPPIRKGYADAARLPLDSVTAGRLLGEGAGVVRSQERRDYDGGTMHWRAYSSAGGLYPVEAYVATAHGLLSFDPLARTISRVGEGDARSAVGEAVDAEAREFVVLTGIHARTGWKYLERGYRHVWWDAGTLLANLLALAAAAGLRPRLYTGFVDRELNDLLGVDGRREVALAVLGIGEPDGRAAAPYSGALPSPPESQRSFPLAEAAHAASALADLKAVRAWRTEPEGEEPRLDDEALARAIRRRRSVREYGPEPLPQEELAALLAWSEAPIPADAPGMVRQVVTAAAVAGLAPGRYDARLDPLGEEGERELRDRAGLAAMDQEHARRAAANVFQLADLDTVVTRLGERGYRWAQLEAGIRAGRLQVGASLRGWGAVASTFFDDEVSRLFETNEAPLLLVSLGARRDGARP